MMKLSLEIPPPDYSTIVNSHNSPPSPPALPPPSSYSPLASPTLSGSWSVNKSQAELTSLLKEAYNVIKEKERDLTLAAEIGKSLLENNIALKSKYEALVVQLQSLQRQRQKATTFALQHASEKSTGIPIAPPANSLDPFAEEFGDYYESDSESINGGGWSSSYDNNYLSSSPDAMVKKKQFNNNRNNQQLTYKEIELIKELELRNQDLQARLDEAIKEYEETDKFNKGKIRKLETDLKHFQETYSQATMKIEDLEKETVRLVEKQKSAFWQFKNSKKSSEENDEFLEALVNKVNELEEQNRHIERQKAETERKLTRVTNELDLLQDQCNQLIDDSKNYEVLQMQNRQQTELIGELSESLEYERSKVVSLRSGMMYSRPGSRFASRSNSFSEHSFTNTLRRLSNPDGMRALFGAAPQSPTIPNGHMNNGGGGNDGGLGRKIKRTLLSELENEWFREINFSKSITGGDESPTSEKSFFANDDDDDISRLDYLSDDEFIFLDQFATENEKAARIREWFWRRWARNIYLFFRLIWRWAKFILILIAANLMAIYRGPDDILPDDM